MSYYTKLYKYVKPTREFFWSVFIFVLVSIFCGRFLRKQLFHSPMLDMRWLQPTPNHSWNNRLIADVTDAFAIFSPRYQTYLHIFLRSSNTWSFMYSLANKRLFHKKKLCLFSYGKFVLGENDMNFIFECSTIRDNSHK